MTKLLIGLLGAGVLATAGYAASTGFEDTTPARTVSLPAATTTGTTTDDTTTAATTTAATTTDAAPDDSVVGDTATGAAATMTGGEDVSGPCDEAEHANDPRCTGVAAGARHDDNAGDDTAQAEDDHAGHGGGDDDGGNDGRSGSNSGKG